MSKTEFIAYAMGSYDFIMKAKGKKDVLEEWLDDISFGIAVPFDIGNAEIYDENDNCIYIKGDCLICPKRYNHYSTHQDELMKTSRKYKVDVEILATRDSYMKHYIYEHDNNAPIDTYGDIDEELLKLEHLTDFKKWNI